jgi:hypothetical protein
MLRGVGAGARLGQAVAGDQLHGRQARQVALAQVVGAEPVDHPRGHVVDGQIGRRRHVAVAQCLENDRCVQTRQARAPDIFLHIDAGETQLGGLAQHVDREVFLLVPLRGMRGKLSFGEGARGLLNGDLIVAEREIHARNPPVRGRTALIILALEVPRQGARVNDPGRRSYPFPQPLDLLPEILCYTLCIGRNATPS